MRKAVLFTAIFAILSCRVTAISLEAEYGTYTGYTVPRSHASGQHTVRLRQGQYVENSFTTRCSCSVTVTNVIYTNDGGSDTITLSLDGRAVGTFRTRSQSNHGNLWNVPWSSGRVGSSTVLGRGVHRVRIEATTTDRYLVEIDKVILALHCGRYSSCRSSSTTPPLLTTATTAAPTTTTAAPTTTTAAPTTNTIPTAISLEAEHGTYMGHTVPRSRASGQRTVRLRQGQYVENSFTTRCSCSVTVTNVIYTNDGGSDTITLSLDGRVVGTFRTHSQSNHGNLWNVPRSSGRVGSSTVLGRGVHRVRIEATTTDRYLVEIDKVILALHCGRYSSCRSSSTTTPPLTTTTTAAPTTTTAAPTTTTAASTTNTIPTAISLEAERGTYTGHTVQRSRASGQRTVRLRQGQYVENSFTTHCSCSVTVTNVIYTNDGGSDTITLSLDGRVVGTFRTRSQSNYGNLWNVPRSSGRVGSSTTLGRGVHRVRIEATTTDRYLVEIDKVILALDCGGYSSCRSSSTTPPPLTTTTTTAPTTNTILTSISLEAERGTYTGHIVQRSRASGQRTVRLRQGQYVENSFTARCSCSVTVTNVIYTNDGGSDTITLSLDGRAVGTFHTRSQSNRGKLWNVPRHSGKIGGSVVLGRGIHTVRIEATRTDRYLVEIDRVILTGDCGLCHSTFTTESNVSKPLKGSLEWLVVLAMLTLMYEIVI